MSITKLFLIFITTFLFFSIHSNAVPLIFDDYDACMASSNSNYIPTSKVGIAFKSKNIYSPDIDEPSRLIIKKFARLINKKQAIQEVRQDIQQNNRQLYGDDAEALLYFFTRGREGSNINGGANIDAWALGGGTCCGIGDPSIEEIQQKMVSDFKQVLSNPEVHNKLVEIAKNMQQNGDNSTCVNKVASYNYKKNKEKCCTCAIL